MKKIIVAGAGHGGLSAAIHLARAGYDVTVYEKRKRQGIGYDWFDAVFANLFERAGIEPPPDGSMLEFYEMRYFAPNMETSITKSGTGGGIRFIDRQVLLEHLLDVAEKSGVKLVFETAVKKAVVSGARVIGLELENGEKIFADLVIDAAGVDSPVRRNLPETCGIMSEIPADDKIFIYRAYFNRVFEGITDPRYNVYFYHCSKPGMDWMITEDDYIDILVGGFGKLSQEDIDAALDDFRSRYPYIGTQIVRGGGKTESIPLRKTLGLFVADGYAAVGDSACMTEPLSGSGISLSMFAGQILANTVIGHGGKTDIGTLWRYQFLYCKHIGEAYIMYDIARKLLAFIDADDVTGLLVKEILTMKEIAGGEKYTPSDIYKKVTGVLSMPNIIPSLRDAALKILRIKSVCEAMPAVYDAEKVKLWADTYEEKL